jgi:hypothetical protein
MTRWSLAFVFVQGNGTRGFALAGFYGYIVEMTALGLTDRLFLFVFLIL